MCMKTAGDAGGILEAGTMAVEERGLLGSRCDTSDSTLLSRVGFPTPQRRREYPNLALFGHHPLDPRFA